MTEGDAADVDVNDPSLWSVERKCTRCGMGFETLLTWGLAFCGDCDYLDQTGVFRPLDPWWTLEGE